MRYALLINEHPGATDHLDADAQAAVSAEYVALRDDERVVGGERLAPVETATTLRLTDGRLHLVDGPFADTKEHFGGFYLVEAPDLDSALELAGRIPAVRFGGSVEVRALDHP